MPNAMKETYNGRSRHRLSRKVGLRFGQGVSLLRESKSEELPQLQAKVGVVPEALVFKLLDELYQYEDLISSSPTSTETRARRCKHTSFATATCSKE